MNVFCERLKSLVLQQPLTFLLAKQRQILQKIALIATRLVARNQSFYNLPKCGSEQLHSYVYSTWDV